VNLLGAIGGASVTFLLIRIEVVCVYSKAVYFCGIWLRWDVCVLYFFNSVYWVNGSLLVNKFVNNRKIKLRFWQFKL